MDYSNQNYGNKKIKKLSQLSSTIKKIKKENKRNKSAKNSNCQNKRISTLQKRTNYNKFNNELYKINKPKTIEYNDCK